MAREPTEINDMYPEQGSYKSYGRDSGRRSGTTSSPVRTMHYVDESQRRLGGLRHEFSYSKDYYTSHAERAIDKFDQVFEAGNNGGRA